MGDKAKRKRNWDSDADRAGLPPHDAIYDGGGKVKEDEFKDMVEWLYKWTRDMSAWGQDLRDDLLRLEGQAGFPSGDPGDPPAGPPE